MDPARRRRGAYGGDDLVPPGERTECRTVVPELTQQVLDQDSAPSGEGIVDRGLQADQVRPELRVDLHGMDSGRSAGCRLAGQCLRDDTGAGAEVGDHVVGRHVGCLQKCAYDGGVVQQVLVETIGVEDADGMRGHAPTRDHVQVEVA